MGIATPSAARRRRLLLPAAALGVSGLLLTACGAPPEQSEASGSGAAESEAIATDRAKRRAWLEARDYRVVDMHVADVERDLDGELARLEGSLPQGR